MFTRAGKEPPSRESGKEAMQKQTPPRARVERLSSLSSTKSGAHRTPSLRPAPRATESPVEGRSLSQGMFPSDVHSRLNGRGNAYTPMSVGSTRDRQLSVVSWHSPSQEELDRRRRPSNLGLMSSEQNSANGTPKSRRLASRTGSDVSLEKVAARLRNTDAYQNSPRSSITRTSRLRGTPQASPLVSWRKRSHSRMDQESFDLLDPRDSPAPSVRRRLAETKVITSRPRTSEGPRGGRPARAKMVKVASVGQRLSEKGERSPPSERRGFRPVRVVRSPATVAMPSQQKQQQHHHHHHHDLSQRYALRHNSSPMGSLTDNLSADLSPRRSKVRCSVDLRKSTPEGFFKPLESLPTRPPRSRSVHACFGVGVSSPLDRCNDGMGRSLEAQNRSAADTPRSQCERNTSAHPPSVQAHTRAPCRQTAGTFASILLPPLRQSPNDGYRPETPAIPLTESLPASPLPVSTSCFMLNADDAEEPEEQAPECSLDGYMQQNAELRRSPAQMLESIVSPPPASEGFDDNPYGGDAGRGGGCHSRIVRSPPPPRNVDASGKWSPMIGQLGTLRISGDPQLSGVVGWGARTASVRPEDSVSVSGMVEEVPRLQDFHSPHAFLRKISQLSDEGVVYVDAQHVAAVLSLRNRPVCHFLDCRFGYEVRGGHIGGCTHIPDFSSLETWFEQRSRQETPPLVFMYCEFSKKRSVQSYKHLRRLDEIRSAQMQSLDAWMESKQADDGDEEHRLSRSGMCSPRGGVQLPVTLPHVFVIRGGYSQFHLVYPELCQRALNGQLYTSMDHQDHREECARLMGEVDKREKRTRRD